MAILGAQFVFSLVMFSFLQKLSPYYSFGRWLLCNRLTRFLHPTDEELKTLAGIPQGGKGKGKRRDYRKMMNNQNKNEGFMVPRNIALQLETAKVEVADLIHLHFYPDYQWLMDFSLSAGIVYILTEMYYAISPHRIEFNISILWCLLTLGFCLRILYAQTSLYFHTEEGGEKVLCVTFGFFYLVLAMGVLVVGDDILEFGLDTGYQNFSRSAHEFLKQRGIEAHGPISMLTFKIILAFSCSILGAFLTFPGLRLAKLHLDALKYAKENYFKSVVLHVNFILPLIVMLSWLKPIGRDILCGRGWSPRGPIISDDVYDNVRLLMVIVLFVARLILLPTHMQSHLNLAHGRMEQLKKESGKINSIELQKMVARVFYYLCVVAVQYVTPVLLMLFLMFLMKTLGDYSWTAFLGERVASMWSTKNVVSGGAQVPSSGNKTADGIIDTAAQFTLAFGNLRNIFTPVWYRGLLSFLTWWVCTVWFTSTGLGMMYYSQIEAA